MKSGRDRCYPAAHSGCWVGPPTWLKTRTPNSNGTETANNCLFIDTSAVLLYYDSNSALSILWWMRQVMHTHEQTRSCDIQGVPEICAQLRVTVAFYWKRLVNQQVIWRTQPCNFSVIHAKRENSKPKITNWQAFVMLFSMVFKIQEPELLRLPMVTETFVCYNHSRSRYAFTFKTFPTTGGWQGKNKSGYLGLKIGTNELSRLGRDIPKSLDVSDGWSGK